MTETKNLTRVLLLTCLRLTGVWGKEDTVFVYSRVRGDALLPCTRVASPDCSGITWTFFKDDQVRYTQEVSSGQVRADSDKSGRMSVTSNCSLSFHDLRVDDAGSYLCKEHGDRITDVYLSLLTITSPSTITDLLPGGDIVLSCILFTFFDAGNCKSYTSMFNLSWVSEDGTVLPENSRYKLIAESRCNVTLVTNLRVEDNNRKWRCQVNTKDNSRAEFLDFTSTFLFNNPPAAQNRIPSDALDCQVQLPVSRIMLCVALPVVLFIVGFFTWRGNCKTAKPFEAAM